MIKLWLLTDGKQTAENFRGMLQADWGDEKVLSAFGQQSAKTGYFGPSHKLLAYVL